VGSSFFDINILSNIHCLYPLYIYNSLCWSVCVLLTIMDVKKTHGNEKNETENEAVAAYY